MFYNGLIDTCLSCVINILYCKKKYHELHKKQKSIFIIIGLFVFIFHVYKTVSLFSYTEGQEI